MRLFAPGKNRILERIKGTLKHDDKSMKKLKNIQNQQNSYDNISNICILRVQ